MALSCFFELAMFGGGNSYLFEETSFDLYREVIGTRDMLLWHIVCTRFGSKLLDS